MKQRTHKRSRYASPWRHPAALRLERALAVVRKQRRELLQNDNVLADLRRMLMVVSPATRRTLRRFVRADITAMRQDGALAELTMMAEFLSPYARRALAARLEAATLARLNAHVRMRLSELDGAQRAP